MLHILQVKFGILMPFEYISSFGTHTLWIHAELRMDRYWDVLYMPTGEIRDSDAIRVHFEFCDSSFMDSCRIKYIALICLHVNFMFQMPLEFLSSISVQSR